MIKRSIWALIAMVGLGIGTATAAVIPHAPVNGLATFEDTITGRVWLQLPDLFGMDYFSQKSTALGQWICGGHI